MNMASAGPSKLPPKVKGPQASTSAYSSNVKKIAPPLPARPTSSSHPSTRKNGTHATLPLKNIQGTKTRRTDSTKDGWDRDVVFVTRNTPLGALMGRCRSLIMVEGYVLIIPARWLMEGIHVYGYMLWQLLSLMLCCCYMLCLIYYHILRGIRGCGTKSELGVRNASRK